MQLFLGISEGGWLGEGECNKEVDAVQLHKY